MWQEKHDWKKRLFHEFWCKELVQGETICPDDYTLFVHVVEKKMQMKVFCSVCEGGGAQSKYA